MAPEGISDVDRLREDEKRLAELGYKQELSREWSGFTNFAISFTIISVLAGCFTAFAFAWSNGGPIAISLGWPILFRPDHHGRVLDVGADLGVPDRGRPVLVGQRPRRTRLELDDRLVQHRRPDRHRRLGRLRRGHLPRGDAQPLRGRHLRHELRRHRARPARDLDPVRADSDRLHDRQHPPRPLHPVDEQRLGRLAPARRRDRHRPAGLRSRQPPGPELRLQRAHQQQRSLRGLDDGARLLGAGAARRLPA